MHAGPAIDDDAASLREALVLLGDWDDEFEFLFAPATPPPLPADEQTQSPRNRPDKRPKRNASVSTGSSQRREVRISTLLDLQTQANDLQRVLENEQARLAAKRANLNKNAETSTALQQECEEIVVRQKRQRVTAKAENAVLRECVATQRAIARRILKLTRKTSAIGELLGYAGVPSVAQYGGPVISVPQHLRYLDCLMDEASGILSAGVFGENRGCEFERVSFRDLGFDGLQVEFAVSWVVPFGVDAVATAVWSLLSGSHHRGRTMDRQCTHSASDLLCASFVSAPHISTHGQPSCNHGQAIPGVMHGQSAVRRYSQDHGGSKFLLTRIRAGIFEDDGKRKGDMSGDGWFQIEPVTNKVTVTTSQVSRIKWCSRVTGRPVDHDTATPTKRSRWVHSVVSGPMRTHWEQNLALNLQAIENLLLQ